MIVLRPLLFDVMTGENSRNSADITARFMRGILEVTLRTLK